MFRGDRRSSTRPLSHVRTCIVSIVSAIVAFCYAACASAFEPQPVPGRVLLKLRADASADGLAPAGTAVAKTGVPELDALNADLGVARFAAVFPDELARQRQGKPGVAHELTRFYSVDFDPTLDLESVRARYEALDAVLLAEYDWMAPLHLQTNDSSAQWHIQTTSGHDAHITGGWNHSTGDPNVILAIADSGVDWMHPDLGGTGPDYVNGNIWINMAEYNGVAGVDDDANGFIDDVRGWDFVTVLNSAAPGEDGSVEDNDPRDFNGHGTHVSGIASAITNNGIGVSGVGFNCKIMALRIGGSIIDGGGNEQGVVFMSYAARALNYARNNGATAFNASWGSAFSATLDAAVDAATGIGDMVIVVSAGNDNSSAGGYLNTRPENDTFSVAATTQNDVRAGFSNFGSWVDVSAPGVAIFSTYFDRGAVGPDQHTYNSLQGTSMSAPLVTGLVGLVRAAWPLAIRSTVEQFIMDGCDNIDDINPAYAGQLGAGRVNALKTFGDRFLSVPADYPNIQLALAQSAPGDTIALRGGNTYTTNILLSRNGRLIQGGWDATFTTRDLGNPAIISGNGTTAVLEVTGGIDATAVFEGLRFRGGVAKTVTNPNGRYGGGVLCRNASPTFRDCEFTSNTAGSDLEFGGGGGAFFDGSSSRLERCTFSANRARVGGALYALNANLQLEDCVFDGNTVHSTGDSRAAAVYVTGGTFTMRGGRIVNSTGAADGGAMLATNAAVIDFEAVEIASNTAARGGGLSLEGGALLDLRSSVVYANLATQLGGGIYAPNGTASIVNTTFDANGGAGAALFVQSAPSTWTLRNCIVSNHATSAAVLFFSSTADLDYNVFWNNTAGDVSGATPGPNTLSADPRYVDAASGDLALGAHSPAIDSGDPDAAHVDADGTRNDRGGFGGPGARSRAPAVPSDFTVGRPNDSNEISWTASPDPDVDVYAVYRSNVDEDFVPSPGNFIANVPANVTIYVDPSAASAWYRVAAVDLTGASSGFTAAVQALPTTGVDDEEDVDTPSAVPFRFALRDNVPNPFNPRTLIRFEIPRAAHVDVLIFDPRGRVVRRLLSASLPAGPNEVLWDGRDEHGRDVSSGTYVSRVVAGRWSASRKLTLLR